MPLPFLDPERIPNHEWRELPLTSMQEERLGEHYAQTRRRSWKAGKCAKHIWARQLVGIWTCDHCPEWRPSL